MRFKTWLYNEIGDGGPMAEPFAQKPELFVRAHPGIINKNDDPPKPAPTATDNYVQKKSTLGPIAKFMKKK